MKFDVVAVNLDNGTLGEIAYGNTMRVLQALEDDSQLDKMGRHVNQAGLHPPNPSLKFGPRENDLTVHNHVCRFRHQGCL
jgi:hypothetical protein